MSPKNIGTEQRMEYEKALETFITEEMLAEIVESFPTLEEQTPLKKESVKKEGKNEIEESGDPRSSYSSKYDALKIEYLIRNKVIVPNVWYGVGQGGERALDRIVPSAAFHAEILAATIFLEALRDMVYVYRSGVRGDELKQEIEYDMRLFLNERYDDAGHRATDVTGSASNREFRRKNVLGSLTNSHGKLSMDELTEVRDIILRSYK
ncbi:MAG: hypothetical protein UT34_C0002G0076 [candidate division WS6 bacterium GW2011_GWF2_39_15]|uniref:Uncharacterized protein n=1 Tax=candidate division WS6 bacterium GW2011_GWF2_39_15 TaxID=1619100 RepID=A0A0G0MNA2_9BACT|nr:MAG: hypothetical protein UT34_C0002G0076 [candidate division WS6 bacterium GW2011_GWF2_39_15]